MIVYIVLNKVNGKVYVGKTEQTLKRRWQRHIWDANHGKGFALHAAIEKYGPDLFEIIPLSVATSREQLENLEIFFISKYRACDPAFGYNLTKGGDGRGGFALPDATKHKISRALRGKKRSNEFREKMRRLMLGRKLSKEHCLHISEAHKGKHLPPFTKEHCYRIGQASKGRKHSQETKRLISEAGKGRIVSEETRQKISLSSRGSKRRNPPAGMAWCSGHKDFFPRTSFQNNKSTFNGLQAYCKDCGKRYYSSHAALPQERHPEAPESPCGI